jgi:hypothetical protein
MGKFRSALLLTATLATIVITSAADAYSLKLPSPTPKPPKYFLTLEGDYILPDEDQVIQSLQLGTQLSNQKTSDHINFAGGIGAFIKDGMFVVIKYRRMTPDDTFTISQGLAPDLDVSNWSDKWQFNFADIDLGKETEINKSVGFHGYIGIGIMNGTVTATENDTDPDADPKTQSQKLKIFGFGPKFGLGTHYNLTNWFGFVGGAETSFYFASFKRLSSTDGSPYTTDWSNYHSTLPVINAYLAAQFSPTPNFVFQTGMRAFHSFNFDTNAFMSIYEGVFLANDLGWFGPYVSASYRF